MELLSDILYRVPLLEVRGRLDIPVRDFHFDSRKIQKDDLFVAISGTEVDGHNYIGKAIEKGASIIVCEKLPDNLPETVVFIRVKDTAQSLSIIAANYFGNPSEKLKIVGITGTNGKTTTATLLHDLFTQLGEECGLLSTVEVRVGRQVLPATHTTPDPKSIHRAFKEMLEEGCEYCFMEVSSHGLVQKRVSGIKFVGGVFTNISHDHLDYHGDFSSYIQAKKMLFDGLASDAFAIINNDDRNGNIMVQNCKAKKYFFSIRQVADFKGRIIENTFEGLHMEIEGINTWFAMCGDFNAYNLLSVYAVATLLGLEKEDVLLKLSKIEGVNGRFQRIHSPGKAISAIVDYAHTPDALLNVLETIQEIGLNGGKLITVVGCGGNRDTSKRPKMARIATEHSNKVILTSDNPRNEDPVAILEDMENGVPISQKSKVMIIENREQAINVACQLASSGDIILVAGKGHETYQDIKGVKYPFDDREIIHRVLNGLRK